ncbi:MAG: flagellar basal body P-ring protein FlgI [bacterium]|nr:flagellar basal body P-ring protein FlgI [bacterium]
MYLTENTYGNLLLKALLIFIMMLLPIAALAQDDTQGDLGADVTGTIDDTATTPLSQDLWTFAEPSYYSQIPEVRVKDIARVLGVRGNQLYGIGLVTGLAGTGDSSSSVDFTAQAIANMLDRAGIPTDPGEIKVDNFATVMVTSDLPAFVREGDSIDITVSAMGDCESLQGGVLIMTPLRAANGEIYAVAQGPVSLAGFGTAGGAGGATTRRQSNFLTVGRIPNGAYVEKEVDFELAPQSILTMVLMNPDFTTAIRLRDAVATAFPSIRDVEARDAASISMLIPDEYQNDVVRFISLVENLTVTPDIPNRVIINERTGTIVMGAGVQIIPVAIAHGALSISITQGFDVSQPPPLSGGYSLAVPESGIIVQDGPAQFVRITSADLVAALNALGATPRDIVAIFQALAAAGALQAELIII